MRFAVSPLLLFLFVAAVSSTAEAQQRRGMGYVPEPEQVYRSFPVAPRFRAFLPAEVDLSPSFPTPGDQGLENTCTAWAVGYGLRSYYAGKQFRWNFSSAEQLISPSFIYSRLHSNETCGTGTPISTALELLKTEGAPTLAAFPYPTTLCAHVPDPTQASIASQFRIRSWRTIEGGILDDIKGQLYAGNPVVFGMSISDTFHDLRSGQIYDDIESPRTGGHAMVLVGYSEKRQAFKLINSWGTGWGENGFAWVSYRALPRLAYQFFVIDVPDAGVLPKPVVVVQPTPKPAPVVTPAPFPKPTPIVVTPAPPTPPPQPPFPVVIAPQPLPPPLPNPLSVLPSIAAVQTLVDNRLRQVGCSRIEANVTVDRTARLRGFAGSQADVGRLRSDLAALPGLSRVDANITVYPWPQCEVFLNYAAALSESRGLRVALSGVPGGTFKAGDSLTIDVVTPTFPSYLYVTYLQASGDAVHLYSPVAKSSKPFPPNTRITFGGGGNQPVYRIGEPFGDEIVVVIASASPLFQDELPQHATEREYLTTFRRAFLAQGGLAGKRFVSATAATLRTESRN